MTHFAKSRAVALSCLLSLAAVAASAAPSTPAIVLATSGTEFESTPYTLGFSFSVQSAVSLDALGVWDRDADGLEAPGEVALWKDGDSKPLTLATVDSGTTATLLGGFRWVPVTALLLSPGQVYVVGTFLDGGWATSFGLAQGGSAVVDGRVAIVEDRFSTDFMLTYPNDSNKSAGGAWLGANLQISAVPEPEQAAMLVAGLAAIALLARRRQS
ncbi:MAG: hypothetical protein CFE40_05565 [Burkholderiales bacterium PBB1]|nr:MAG: hypothetical protein CFE40_05565 [Burkholderiales bacterium PBB1]